MGLLKKSWECGMRWAARGKSSPRKKGYRYPFSVIVPWGCLCWMVEKGTSLLSFAYPLFSAFCGGGFFFNRPTVPIFWHFAGPIQSMRYLAKGLSFFCDYALGLLELVGGKRYQSPFFRLSAFFCFSWGRLLFQQVRCSLYFGFCLRFSRILLLAWFFG